MKKCLNLGSGCKLMYNTPEEEWWNLDQRVPQMMVPDNTNLITGDVTDIVSIFPEGSFDKIYSQYLFEHLTGKQILDLLYQMKMVLKPDGMAVVRVPNFLGILLDFEVLATSPLKYEDVELVRLRIFGAEKWTWHRTVWTPNSGMYYLGMDNLFIPKLVSQDGDPDKTLTFELTPRK